MSQTEYANNIIIHQVAHTKHLGAIFHSPFPIIMYVIQRFNQHLKETDRIQKNLL
jgi:hypothetical protein